MFAWKNLIKTTQKPNIGGTSYPACSTISYVNATKSFDNESLWLMHALTKRRHRTAKGHGVIFRKISIVNSDMKNQFAEIYEFWQG